MSTTVTANALFYIVFAGSIAVGPIIGSILAKRLAQFDALRSLGLDIKLSGFVAVFLFLFLPALVAAIGETWSTIRVERYGLLTHFAIALTLSSIAAFLSRADDTETKPPKWVWFFLLLWFSFIFLLAMLALLLPAVAPNTPDFHDKRPGVKLEQVRP